jgi:hypothetical protein
VVTVARAAGGDWRGLLRKGEALGEYARRRIRQALLESLAFARILVALRVAYLLELVDLALRVDGGERRFRLAATLGYIHDEVTRFVYKDCFKEYWDRGASRVPYSLHARLLGLCYEEMSKLASGLEREGLREFAEYYRHWARLALLAGRAVELVNAIAYRTCSAGWTGACMWGSWDKWAWTAFFENEWGERVILELVEAAAREDVGKLRALLRKYAEELAQHAVFDEGAPWDLPPEVAEQRRRRYHPLPGLSFFPILKVDEQAVKALEELRELRPLERVREVTEEMRLVVEELERKLGGAQASTR